MIIEMLLSVIFKIFSTLSSPINIPSLPQDVTDLIADAFAYLETGAGILMNYTHFDYIGTLFLIILAVDVGVKIYHFVMWVIRKIPMLGMS